MKQTFPESVDRLLREYSRQRNALLFWRGFLLAFIVVLGWLMVWCLVDRIAQLSAAWRTIVLLVTAAAAIVWLVLLFRVLLSKVAPQQAAMELETIRPDLDERLATICSRLADDRDLASREMLGAIAQQVEQYIQANGIPQIVSFRSLARHITCAGIMIAVLLGMWMVPVLGMPQLMNRMLVPWVDIAPVTTTRLVTLYDQNRLEVKENETIILNANVINPGEEGVMLHYSTDGQTWESRPMQHTGLHSYQAAIGPISNDQRIYLSSGDARTKITNLVLLRRPAITEFRIRYEYPQYMKRESFLARNVDGLLEAPVGTKASVQVVVTEKLKSATLEAEDFTIPLRATVDPRVMECELTITRDQPYRIAMVSTRDIEGKGPQGSQIRALPDRPPFVQLITPSDDVRLGPRDLTSVRFQAMDDYGIGKLSMRLQVNNAQPIDVPIKTAEGSRRTDGNEELDMANLGLKVGDVVAVSLTAADIAGQESVSETRYLFISPHSVSTDDYIRLAELQRAAQITKNLATELDEAKKSLERARSEKDLEKRAQLAEKYQQRVAESGRQAENLRTSLTRAVARVNDEKLADTLATFADRAQVRMMDAHDLVDELGKGEAREANAQQRLERSLAQTRDMQKQLEALANAERAAAALADRRNLQAAEAAQETGKITPRASEMLERMRQDVNDQAQQLGLDPADPELDKKLENKANEGRKVAEAVKQLDLVEAANWWSQQLLDEKIHAPMFDRRLLAAADVESIRNDSNLQRARDLEMSSRAAQAIWLMSRDPQARAIADELRKEFVQAFSELEKQNATRTGQDRSEEELRRAAQARARMAEWAGETSTRIGPDDMSADELQQRQWAIEANEHMYNRRYDRASELQRRMALEQQQALQAAQALQEAQEIDEIGAMQDSLRQQLQASQAEAAALAQRQREVARRIESQMGRSSSIPGEPVDTRKEALAAIQAVQERLAMMPQQLQEAVQSADVQFQAHGLTQRLKQDVEKAPPERKEAAERAAERAVVAEEDARKQTEMSLATVDPDIVRVMTSSLADYLPETVEATRVLQQDLAPALQQVRQSAIDNKAPEMLRAVRQSRDAIAKAQSALRDAQQAVLDRDPLFAARMYADAAAEALSKHPPDVVAAAENQALASEALNRQWQQSIREAAVAHLSGVSQFAQVYDPQSPTFAPTDRVNLAGAREWGILRSRPEGDISATVREEDPTGYQKMLQVYFRTLGKSRQEEGGN